MRHTESDTQQACVRWFRLQYPEFAPLLFAVPNGGRRDARTGRTLKAEGVVAGVADILLLKASADGTAHGLCIEMKTTTGRQSPEQRQWQKAVTDEGYTYAVCRSFDDFYTAVERHLKA